MIFQNCFKFHSPNGSWNYVKQFRNIARCIYAKYHYKSCYYLYQYALGVGFEFTLRVVARSVFVWNCTLCWPDVLIVRKSGCSLFLRAMNLAVVFKCYSITNNYGLNNKFSSYSWDAIINRKKHWSPAPARTLQDGIKENSTLHLYRTASYSNSLIFFTGYKCKKGKIISSFIIKYSLWCVNLLISEILKSVCVFPELVTRLKRSVSKQATEQSWSKYFLNLIAFLSFKTS